MREISCLRLGAFAGLSGHHVTCSHHHKPQSSGPCSTYDEQKAAAQIAEIVATAWTKNDSEPLAGLFLPDAVLIMPTGSVAHSRTATKKDIIDERNGKLKNTPLQNTIAGVAFTSTQAAVVKGNYQLLGMRILDSRPLPLALLSFTKVNAKDGG